MDYTLEKAAQAQDYELQQAALELDRQKLALEQAYTMAQISQIQFEQGLAQAEFEAAQLANVAEQTVSSSSIDTVPEWKKGGGGDDGDSGGTASREFQMITPTLRDNGMAMLLNNLIDRMG